MLQSSRKSQVPSQATTPTAVSLCSIAASRVYGVQPTVWAPLKGAGSYRERYKTPREYDPEASRGRFGSGDLTPSFQWTVFGSR